jgi:transcriptional regulator with XRE-family HTH domain
MDNGWSARSDKREEPYPRVGAHPAAGLVRRVRRVADLSQRELADRCGLAQSTVAAIEMGEPPSVDALRRILAAADLYLVAVDGDGRVVTPVPTSEAYPAHIEGVLDPRPGCWWADEYGLTRPPRSFTRSFWLREARRELSRWEARPGKYTGRRPEVTTRGALEAYERGEPWPPPLRPRRAEPEVIDISEWDVDEWDGDP